MNRNISYVVCLGLVACSSKDAERLRELDTDVAAAEIPAAPSASIAREPVERVLMGVPGNPDPHIAKQAALRDAMEFGMIGMLNSGAGGDPDAPKAPWLRDDSLGNDPLSARGNMWGDEIGDAFGAGGLGLKGIGEGKGGGGGGEGIGLGSIGTLGHGAGTGTGQGFGSGSGRLTGSSRTKPPTVRMGATSVSGKLPPEVIQRIVRQNFGRFRLCYENGLKKDAKLAGRVNVSFTIKQDGSVSDVTGGGDMPDKGVVACVTKAFNGLSFPTPESGVVKVTYPIAFAPGDDGGSASGSSSTGSGDVKSGGSGSGGATTGPTIGGKLLEEATGVEVEKALRAAGCTDVTSKAMEGATGVMVFTVKKGQKTFTVTFAPSKVGAAALPPKELERLKSVASIRRSGAFFLAVEGDDKDGAKALLDELVKA